jgi:hypothetical protein
MMVEGKSLGDVMGELSGKDVPGGGPVAAYELVMVTSEDARYLTVQRVEVDHERRKVYLHG